MLMHVIRLMRPLITLAVLVAEYSAFAGAMPNCPSAADIWQNTRDKPEVIPLKHVLPESRCSTEFFRAVSKKSRGTLTRGLQHSLRQLKASLHAGRRL